jgi:uncharacterized protein (TIGR03083 family)
MPTFYDRWMILAPRYDGPPILTIDGHPSDQLQPLTRQRRRMQAMLAELSEEEWLAPSRCAEWRVRDVVAHLVGVNAFWNGSIRAGLAGTPTRVLGGFDPAATPPLMVAAMSEATVAGLLADFVTTNDALLGVSAELTDNQWSVLAESPAGHVSVRLLAQHALWDCWVHERDIAIPLARSTAAEADELISCLQYAAAASPVLGMGLAQARAGVYAVEASDPSIHFSVDVTDSVTVRNQAAAAGVPCLCGDTIELIEGLSLRASMPESTPDEWRQLLGGLETVFDAAAAP